MEGRDGTGAKVVILVQPRMSVFSPLVSLYGANGCSEQATNTNQKVAILYRKMCVVWSTNKKMITVAIIDFQVTMNWTAVGVAIRGEQERAPMEQRESGGAVGGRRILIAKSSRFSTERQAWCGRRMSTCSGKRV